MTLNNTWRQLFLASLLALALLFALMPQAGYAADNVTRGLEDLKGETNGALPTDTPANQSLASVLGKVINYALAIGFAIAVVMVIYGGYQYIFSAGSEEKATSARSTIIYALIGMVVIILSFVIVNVVVSVARNGVGNPVTGNNEANNANLPPPAPGTPDPNEGII